MFNQDLAPVRRRAGRFVMALAMAASLVVVWSNTAHASGFRFVATAHLSDKISVRDISCRTADDCVIVGVDIARTFDGHTVSRIPGLDGPGVVSADGRDMNAWHSVSCSSDGACMITGLDNVSGGSEFRASPTSAWVAATLPMPSDLPANVGLWDDVQSLSCSSASFCLLVGTYDTDAGNHIVQVWRWDGKQWHLGHLSPTDPSEQTHLTGVSCWAAFQCLVVGSRHNSHGQQVGLEAVLDGSKWKVADLGHVNGEADVVSCWSAMRCLVAGSHLTPNSARAHAKDTWLWTGASFVGTSQADPFLSDEAFDSLSCTSAQFCIGARSHLWLSDQGPIAERWDGSTWRRVPSHTTNLGVGEYEGWGRGVSCPTAYNCRMVAAVENTGGNFIGDLDIESSFLESLTST